MFLHNRFMLSLSLLATIFLSPMSLAQDLSCSLELLNQVNSEHRKPLTEWQENYVQALKTENYSGPLAVKVIAELKANPQTEARDHYLPTTLFPKEKVFRSWALADNQILKDYGGCLGGEFIERNILCEENLMQPAFKCIVKCEYVNRAEDCIPD